MSEKFRRDRTIGFQNTFYTKCINIFIDSSGPSIILRSIYLNYKWIDKKIITILSTKISLINWTYVYSILVGHPITER